MAYDPEWRNRVGASKTKRVGKVLNDDRADWCEAGVLFPGDVTYVWHGALHAAEVAQNMEATGFTIHSQIIWNKTVLSRGHYHWQHEPCWYAVRDKGHRAEPVTSKHSLMADLNTALAEQVVYLAQQQWTGCTASPQDG